MIVYNQQKMMVLQTLLESKLDDLISALGLNLKKNEKMYYGQCCIHGGDNPTALNLYHNSSINRNSNWKCYTHNCQEIFKKNIIGFVRGVLSHQNYGWSDAGNKTYDFNKTVDWCLNFLQIKYQDLKLDKIEIEKKQFINSWLQYKNNTIKNKENLKLIKREDIIKYLQIPAIYFINRGFSPSILKKYDVGIPKSNSISKEMINRVIIPIYDESGQYFVGCTGRTLNSLCQKCNCYHINNCPSIETRFLYSKWKHNNSFNKNSNLYNWWNAAKHIKKTGIAALTEGPIDVWRLEEGNVNVGLSIYGTELSEQQKILLEKSGAMHIILLLDNDNPGNQAIERIQRQLNRSFKLILPPSDRPKDVGESSIEYIKAKYLPIIRRFERKL